jgi:hypothetical protein
MICAVSRWPQENEDLEIRGEDGKERAKQQDHQGKNRIGEELAGMVASTGTGRKHAGDVKPQAEDGQWGGCCSLSVISGRYPLHLGTPRQPTVALGDART